MMLACFAPIALAYTFITARSTTQIFSADLKAETRIAQRALNASLTPDIQQHEWNEIRYIMSAIGREDLIAAVLDERGKIQFALTDFPVTPPPQEWIAAQIRAHGAAEYMQKARGLTLDQLEHEYIHTVLASVAGNKTEAAAILGIDRKTLYRKLEENEPSIAAEPSSTAAERR